jgi:hypothetical protein
VEEVLIPALCQCSMVKVFLGKDLMETGCAVQVKTMWVECLPSGNNGGIGRLVLEETNPIEDVLLPMETWAMPASSLRWAAERLGQLTTQWPLPHMNQFFLLVELASI